MATGNNDLTAKIRIDGDAAGAEKALQKTVQGMEAVDKQGRQAAGGTKTLNDAFATLGIRSASQIKADMLAIDQALMRLASNSRLSGDEFNRAFAAGQEQLAKLRAELDGLPVESTKSSIGGLSGAFSSLNGVLAALGIGSVSEKFLQANLAADKLQKSLNAVNGDAAKTASDLAFLKDTAQRLGIDLVSASNGFVKLAAAAKGTSLEGQATRDIFTQIGGAMAQLGLSAADTDRAFISIGQMMSKGTVMAEELKGQLGDVLPGALQMAARATGLTTSELGKLMETGGVLAEDFLPRFAAEVERSFGAGQGEVQGLSNAIARMKNTWTELLAAIGEGGGLKILGVVAGSINGALVVLASTIGVVINGLVGMAEAVGVVVAAFASRNFTGLADALSEIGSRVGQTNERLAAMSNRALGLGDSMQRAGDATSQAGEKAALAGPGWDKLNSAYSQAAKLAADYAEQAKKTAKANDEQAAVLLKLAQLSGNDNQIMLAKEEAASRAAQGAEAVARALDNEAKALQAKVVALQEETKGQQNVSEEKVKAIEEARRAATAKTEEARAAIANADASKVAAAAAQVEANARADNSARVGELKTAYEQAAVAVDVLKAAQTSGAEVGESLKTAQLELARTAALYKDALADQTAKIQQNLSVKQAQLGVEQAGIRLAIEQQRTIYEVARARGDEYGAAQALMEMKRLEIKLAELTAKAKAAEAEAILLTVSAKREELIASGQLTPAKEAELRAQEASANVKKVEAKIAQETAERMRELADITLYAGNAAGSASGGFDSMANSMGRAADAAGRLRSAQGGGPQQGGDGVYRDASGGHVDKNGNPILDRNGKQVTNSTSLLDQGNSASVSISSRSMLYKSGATVEEAKAAEKYFGELLNRKMVAGSGSVRSTEDNNRLIAASTKAAAEEAIALARRELATGQAVDLGNSVSDIVEKNLAQLSNRNFGQNSGIAFDAIRESIAAAGREAQQQTIRLELGAGDKKSTLYAPSQRDAMEFIRTLEAAGMRAAR